ncbi:hypothetical protein LSS_18314 [Leptospira santarosai serovar Shermani str. LT 821]|uniref:Uncharacterized protein n=1 Tax=Leptospira santarosai serovar Shermani str. LT 821 TaxID=758847 RepID=K8Y640_9LEPT|nr:hypothetical protein LSS_18314 [Leptospira santarosai serovar Shermani str. LT 821]
MVYTLYLFSAGLGFIHMQIGATTQIRKNKN